MRTKVSNADWRLEDQEWWKKYTAMLWEQQLSQQMAAGQSGLGVCDSGSGSGSWNSSGSGSGSGICALGYGLGLI